MSDDPNAISAARFPTFWQLFGAFLNADWPLEYATPEDAVEDYRRSLGTIDRSTAVSEIDRLLAIAQTDAAMRAALERLDCMEPPKEDAVLWIRRLRATLARES